MAFNDLCIAVTRFNWPHPKWDGCSTKVYLGWVEQRIEAFRMYTLPSIRNCYVKPDSWYILCDNRIATEIEDTLYDLLVGLDFRLLIYSGCSLRETIIEELSGCAFPLRVRMTRLDSDDLVASDFFARIKALDVPESGWERPIVVSFPGGCNFDAEGKEFYFSSYPENPFLTLIEALSEPRDAYTVYCRMHTVMLRGEFGTRLLRSNHPMWASVIHGGNLQNQSLIQQNRFAFKDVQGLRNKFGIRERNPEAPLRRFRRFMASLSFR